jgi:hypothetical protein
MNKILILIVLLCSYFFNKIHAQVVLQLEKVDVLFVGVENIVTIAVENNTIDNLTFKASNAAIIHVENNKFKVLPEKPGTVTINIFKKEQNIGTHTFRARNLPEPEWYFKIQRLIDTKAQCGNNGLASLKDYEIHVKQSSFPYDVRCEMLSLDFTLVGKNNKVFKIANKGNFFNDEIKTVVEKAEIGDMLYFEKVKCRCGFDKTVINLRSATIQLKR